MNECLMTRNLYISIHTRRTNKSAPRRNVILKNISHKLCSKVHVIWLVLLVFHEMQLITSYSIPPNSGDIVNLITIVSITVWLLLALMGYLIKNELVCKCLRTCYWCSKSQSMSRVGAAANMVTMKACLTALQCREVV